MSILAELALSYPKILKVSSDQTLAPLDTSQLKLPVRLYRCASAKYISLCRSELSTRFWSSIAANRLSLERRRDSVAFLCAALSKFTKVAVIKNRTRRGSSVSCTANTLDFMVNEFIGYTK
jgi:hypothetical protein